MPLKMVLADEHNTDLDKHFYSQYRLQIKKLDDLERLEWENDPQNKYAKDPFFKRLMKRNRDKAGDTFENAFWRYFSMKGIDYAVEKIYPKASIFGRLEAAFANVGKKKTG